ACHRSGNVATTRPLGWRATAPGAAHDGAQRRGRVRGGSRRTGVAWSGAAVIGTPGNYTITPRHTQVPRCTNPHGTGNR
ncbi:hypothetical protein, partial [Cognatiluteimonas telluris]|uniref:hypothetical protein n=1 Tax=Cognatiluteimonas telluris TaxID=1104775 RepID=UPI001A9CA728